MQKRIKIEKKIDENFHNKGFVLESTPRNAKKKTKFYTQNS